MLLISNGSIEPSLSGMRKQVVPTERMADEGHGATDTAQMMLDRAYDAAVASGKYEGVDGFIGGTGSGKSVTSEATPLSAERRVGRIILESHAENAENLAAKIDKALEEGLPVDMHVVIRDPVESYKSVVGRYERAEGNEPGSGKVVPVNSGAATHEAVTRNVPKLFERFTDDPLVTWHFIDNRGTPVEAEEVSAEDGLGLVESLDTNALQGKFNDVLDNAKLTKRDRERFGDRSLPSEFGSESEVAELPGYGDRNRVFTNELLARSQQSLRRKLNPNKLSGGIDPTALPDLLAIAGYHLEAGSIEFADWSSRMINDVGDWIVPHLEELYRKTLQSVYWRARRPGLAPEEAGSLGDIIAKVSNEELLETQRNNRETKQMLGASRPRLVKASARIEPGVPSSGARGNNQDIILGGVDEPEEPPAAGTFGAHGGPSTEQLATDVGLEDDKIGATTSTYSTRPTHLSQAEVNQLMSRPDMKVTDKKGAGAARRPRHHLFPQDNWEWFDNHKIVIDRYTIEMSEGEHSAIHTMGWNLKVQEFINREKLLRRTYTRWEIFRFINLRRREFGLKGRKVVSYYDD